MKKVFVLLVSILALSSCKNKEENKEPIDESLLVEIKAEYIYYADAAVLKGTNFIYGVTLDEKAEELAEKIKPVKVDEYDMVPVVVKGIVNPKPEGQEGWDEIFTIVEIVSVSKTASQPDVKLE